MMTLSWNCTEMECQIFKSVHNNVKLVSFLFILFLSICFAGFDSLRYIFQPYQWSIYVIEGSQRKWDKNFATPITFCNSKITIIRSIWYSHILRCDSKRTWSSYKWTHANNGTQWNLIEINAEIYIEFN